jgi:uncharacterized protein (DUF2252 family)
MDIISHINTMNRGRDPQRLALKYAAMRGSAFAFLRGSCSLFYARLPRGGVFKLAPLVWCCGDLHLENFGSYQADNRLTYFDINDFDESALAPASWDLVRFLTSVLIGAEEIGVGQDAALDLCRLFTDSYSAALGAGKAYWVERDTATGLIGQLLESLRQRGRAEFLDARTNLKGDKRVLNVDGQKALPATAAERREVAALMKDFAKAQVDPDFYKMLDVARRIAGTGSLGVERYVVLVRGNGSPDANHLLDLKLSLRSALEARLKTPQPRWSTQAHRVAEVQRRMQAMPVAFLHPVLMDQRPFVLRALQPAQDRISLKRATPAQWSQLIADMGRIVAWSQLRSSGRQGSATADELVDFGSRRKWKVDLHAAAIECAAQVRLDAAIFDAALDNGTLQP